MLGAARVLVPEVLEQELAQEAAEVESSFVRNEPRRGAHGQWNVEGEMVLPADCESANAKEAPDHRMIEA